MSGQNFKLIHSDAEHAIYSLQNDSVQCVVVNLDLLPVIKENVPAQQKVKKIVRIFNILQDKLKSSGTVFLIMNNPYMGVHPSGKVEQVRFCPGQLSGLPWRVVEALQADGWIWRADIVVNTDLQTSMQCPDRPLRTHSYIFMLSHNEKYFFNKEFSKQGSFWDFSNPKGKKSNWRFEVAKRCILSATQEGDTVLDFCCGDGIVGIAALKCGRKFIGADGSIRELEAAYNLLNNIEPDIPLEPVMLDTSSDNGRRQPQLALFTENEWGIFYNEG